MAIQQHKNHLGNFLGNYFGDFRTLFNAGSITLEAVPTGFLFPFDSWAIFGPAFERFLNSIELPPDDTAIGVTGSFVSSRHIDATSMTTASVTSHSAISHFEATADNDAERRPRDPIQYNCHVMHVYEGYPGNSYNASLET